MDGPRILTAPAPEAAVEIAREKIGTCMVQFVGACTVDYQGRAKSTLASGERLILFKPDGTLLVHTSEGTKPVNWQPGPTSTGAAVKGDEDDEPRLVLTVERSSPREIVTVVFEEIHLVSAFELKDDEDLDLFGTEADIQQLLRMHPHLIEEGFEPYDIELDRRRGPMDIYGHDVHGNRTVVEVKRRTAGIEEATQLARYVERERDIHGEVRGLLAAPGISEKAMMYLKDKDLEFCELDMDELLPKIPRTHANQETLGAFGEAE